LFVYEFKLIPDYGYTNAAIKKEWMNRVKFYPAHKDEDGDDIIPGRMMDISRGNSKLN
jgi:hypothetical protein